MIFNALALLIFSGAAKADALLTQIEKKYQSASSVQMQVQKKLFIELLGQERLSEGQIFIKKGGLFRWVISKPQKQEVYLTPKVVWVVDYPQDPSEKITALKLKKPKRNQSPAVVSFLMGKGELSKNFSLVDQKAKDGALVYHLKAKSSHEVVQELDLRIDKKEMLIVGLEYKDQVGNKTELVFSAVNFNMPMQKKDFEFNPPKNISISVLN